MSDLIINPEEVDLGDFSVKRALPSPQIRMVGPWIFFDHMGPAIFKSGKGIDVRPHPHINLAAVTYLFEGQLFHRDSLGNAQEINPGAINLMVAGKGIVHSERELPEFRSQDHKQHGLQLWHALPIEYEEIEPEFYHYKKDEIPTFDIDNSQVKLLIGDAYDHHSPVKTFSNTLYLEVWIPAHHTLEIPEIDECAIYNISGECFIESQTVSANQMYVSKHKKSISVKSIKESHLAVIGGSPIGERFIEWNFVSSSKERIENAKNDWKTGAFPKVPGDDVEFIPLP